MIDAKKIEQKEALRVNLDDLGDRVELDEENEGGKIADYRV